MARYDQPKVVVSTNVAETSVTIDGVRLVIDSGLARIPRYDANRGINTLLIEKISQASSDQRAGRAGRTAPGRCIRLWSRPEHDERAPQELPEIKRLDLAEVVLTLKAAGVEDHAVIGGLVAIHQFCRVGKMAMIGGCAKVVQDVPPFMIADGNAARTVTVNKVGMERNGVSEEAQTALRQAYKILFRAGLTIPNALEQIEKELPLLSELAYLINFVRTSERGIGK